MFVRDPFLVYLKSEDEQMLYLTSFKIAADFLHSKIF